MIANLTGPPSGWPNWRRSSSQQWSESPSSHRRKHTSTKRTANVEVLGEEFDGLLGCDYFSAYRKHMRDCEVLVQFCLAHLIRDVKFLLPLPGRADQAYGQRVREALRELFAVIHRREKMTAAGSQ